MADRTITRTSSTRNVDAYRVGSVLRSDGDLVVITASSRRPDDHGTYVYTMTVRAADAAERKAARVAELRHKLSVLSVGPDDDRQLAAVAADRDRHENELLALEGRPTVEQDRADAAAKREAETPAKIAAGVAQLDVPRDAKVADDDGYLIDAREWGAIRDAIYLHTGRGLSIADAEGMSDADLRALLS